MILHLKERNLDLAILHPFLPASLLAAKSPLKHMLQASHCQLQHNFLFYAYNKCAPNGQSELKSVEGTGGAESRAQGSSHTQPRGEMGWLFSSADGVP